MMAFARLARTVIMVNERESVRVSECMSFCVKKNKEEGVKGEEKRGRSVKLNRKRAKALFQRAGLKPILKPVTFTL